MGISNFFRKIGKILNVGQIKQDQMKLEEKKLKIEEESLQMQKEIVRRITHMDRTLSAIYAHLRDKKT